MSYQPYTYLIGWSDLDKWYYGCQYSKTSRRNRRANPKNLWSTYFTSSSEVKKFRDLHGDPDVVKVHKVFETAEEALLLEQRILKWFDAASDERWLNQSNGGKHFRTGSGWHHKPKTIEKLKQHSPSPEMRQKISQTLTGRPRPDLKGRKFSPETIEKMRKAKEGYVPWNKGKAGYRSEAISAAKKGKPTWNKGKEWSPEMREKLSQRAKERWQRIREGAA